MSTPYSGNATATQSPSPQPGPGYVPIFSLPNDGNALNAASVAQALKAGADGLAWLASYITGRDNPLWGTGADGPATISGTVTLAREWNYTNLTIANLATLNARGYPIRCKGTLTFNAGAIGIIDNGGSASQEVGGVLPSPRAWSWFGSDGATAPVGPASGVNANNFALNCIGGRGGIGGSSTGGRPGGAAGNANSFQRGFGVTTPGWVSPPIAACLRAGFVDVLNGTTLNAGYPDHFSQALIGGTGAGSGGSDASNRGGGGGGGGGICMVFARHIVVTGTTTGFLGSGPEYSPICARGGIGSFVSGTGGSGGGGGGGVVLVACADWSGVALTAACVSGGADGSIAGGPAGAAAGLSGAWAVLTGL